MVGGGVTGGTCAFLARVIFAADGGGVVGGAASLVAKAIYAATGGAVGGGAGVFISKIVYTMDGGAVVGGTIRPWGGFYVGTPVTGVTWADVSATDDSDWKTYDGNE
jgi:hypothetical protein